MSSDPVGILENITDALFSLDNEWRFVYLNSEAEHVLFRKREDLLGKNVWQEFPVFVDLKFYPEYHKAVAEGITAEFEEYYPPLETWFEVRAYPSEDGLLVHFRDITGRKQAENELKESEANHHALLEDLPELICRSWPDLTRAYVNEGYCRYFGKSRQELIGRSFLDLLPEEDHEPLKEHLASLSRENPVGTFEHRVWRHDGEIRWQQWTHRAIYDEQGRFVGYHAVGRDFNVRRMAEEALKANEKRFRSLTDATFEGIVISEEEAILETNQAFAEMFGYQLSEVRGMGILEFHAPEFREQVRQRISSPSDGSYEPVGVRKDGTTFEVEVHEKTAPHGDDETIRVSAIRDITERKQTEQALKEIEQRFRQLFEQSVDALFVHDEKGRFVDCNSQACRLLGYSREELLSLSVGDVSCNLLTEEERVARGRQGGTLWQKVMAGEPGTFSVSHEEENRRKDGTTFPVEVRVGSVDYGGKQMILTSIHDITERKQAEETLKEQQDFLHEVIDTNPNLIFVKDWDGIFTLANKAVADVYGTTVEELIGKSDADFNTNEEEVEGFLQADREVMETLQEKYIPEEPVTDSSTGRVRWFQTTKVPLTSSNSGSHRVLGVSVDITERKVLEERLRHQALHDALTSLPNRTLFMDYLERTLAGASRRGGKAVAVLFMDLDDFKVVNDSLGHEAGDQLLVALSRRLLECLRPMDIAARFGGDEFAILLRDVEDVSDAVYVADRIAAELLKAPFTLAGQEVFITPSIGIALSSSGGDMPEDLLRDADAAMYRAKDKKAYYQVFDPAIGAHAMERLRLETDLRRAIERDEFKVCYQPKVELASNKVVGMEALLRWKHPTRGLMNPGEFVPVAEATGLIVPIGRWVIEQACRQAREWHERHPGSLPLIMSVNLSARQFQHPGLIADVDRILKDTGLGPGALNLEITESVVMEDAQLNIATLRQLKELGVKLIIDDFGIGHSSLSYLSRLPIDLLKIDRSFVDGIGQRAADLQVVSAVISLAHILGLGVVAEGVEDEEQLAKLRELGCDLAQGNYFSKPLSIGAASELLLNSA